MTVPNCLNECHDVLLKVLNPEDFKWIKEMSKHDLATTHHSLGRWIRNNWGLWEGNNSLFFELKLLGLQHPDDMSSVIIKEFWLKLHDQPSELSQDIQLYNEYWENLK